MFKSIHFNFFDSILKFNAFASKWKLKRYCIFFRMATPTHKISAPATVTRTGKHPGLKIGCDENQKALKSASINAIRRDLAKTELVCCRVLITTVLFYLTRDGHDKPNQHKQRDLCSSKFLCLQTICFQKLSGGHFQFHEPRMSNRAPPL